MNTGKHVWVVTYVALYSDMPYVHVSPIVTDWSNAEEIEHLVGESCKESSRSLVNIKELKYLGKSL